LKEIGKELRRFWVRISVTILIERYPTYGKKRKANWICHVLRGDCLLKRVIEGKIKGRIEVTGRRGRRRKKLLAGLKGKNRILDIEEALDRSLWRTCCGRGY